MYLNEFFCKMFFCDLKNFFFKSIPSCVVKSSAFVDITGEPGLKKNPLNISITFSHSYLEIMQYIVCCLFKSLQRILLFCGKSHCLFYCHILFEKLRKQNLM